MDEAHESKSIPSIRDATILVGTTNKHKVHEIADVLSVLPVHLLSLSDVAPVDEPVEDADSFGGNARIKALHYARASGLLVLADDSGLCVEALGGGPGIHSSRYAGGAGDAANNALLLANLREVKGAQRRAAFVCALCLAAPHQDGAGDASVLFEGEGRVEGTILDSLCGSEGFGYDPLFRPDGHALTFGQIPPEIKRGISHRTAALRLLLSWLRRD